MTWPLKVYLRRAVDQPAAGYALLTSRCRDGSGGFAAYRGFWADISYAAASRIVAVPSARTVSDGVRYRHRDGSRTLDRATLAVGVEHGRCLVDGEL